MYLYSPFRRIIYRSGRAELCRTAWQPESPPLQSRIRSLAGSWLKVCHLTIVSSKFRHINPGLQTLLDTVFTLPLVLCVFFSYFNFSHTPSQALLLFPFLHLNHFSCRPHRAGTLSFSIPTAPVRLGAAAPVREFTEGTVHIVGTLP